MRKFSVITLACFCSALCCMAEETTKVLLPKGTGISVRITESVSSKGSSKAPICVVAGDVYDDSGEYVLIKAGTRADVQMKTRKGTLSGDVGRIEFLPISTTAFNGRLVTLDGEQLVVYMGNESIVNSMQQVKITEGTTFLAYVLNDMYFTIR